MGPRQEPGLPRLLARRRLPGDWAARCGVTPAPVEIPRHDGGASGWIRVGTTKGRGRCDRNSRAGKPKKDIWLCPLRRDWKQTLNR